MPEVNAISRWRWRLNRLRTMGAGEIFYRTRSAIRTRLEALAVGRRVVCPAPGNVEGPNWVHRPDRADVDFASIESAADEVLTGRFDVFAMHGAQLGFPPQWLRDPKTGRVSPLIFGKAMDYRSEALVGDVKYLWEPSRHLQLVTLAQAFSLTEDERYAAGARTLLDSWFDQCPYPLGVHWTSSLELAVRLVNWSVAWQLLAPSPIFQGESGTIFRRRWLGNVYLHQRFIAGHLSRHSSANNHLFGELMGLFIAAVTWPCWSESANWRLRAQYELQAEALKQNAPDGVNREQAVWYHHEVTDMMLLAGLAARAAGIDLGRAYWQRLEAMLGFVCSLMDAAGHVPMIGDADDAVMVRFVSRHDFNVYRSLLASGAVLFERPDFARKAGSFDDKSRWLLGDAAGVRFRALQQQPTRASDDPPAVGRVFPDGGYVVMGDRFGQCDEIKLIVDAGPLGYLSIAAHGHADALALTLNVAGHEMLIDPGTYTYRANDGWRTYFKGTSAHNTVRIDGQDQSVAGGSFMWLEHAHAHCEFFETTADNDRFAGSHDGYRRLDDPVTHRREIDFVKAARSIEIRDTLECRGSHDVEVHWHFAEHCDVTLEADSVLVRQGNVRLRISLAGAAFEPECVIGQVTPPLGWLSRHFDAKCPSPTVRWRGKVMGPTRWTTRFDVEITPPARGECDASRSSAL